MKTFKKDALRVEIYPTRAQMGEAAARDIEDTIQTLLTLQDEVNVIFAAAPSQNEVLAALVKSEKIDWTRVNAFHMDEYIGLDAAAPQAFGNFLKQRIFSLLPFASVSYIDVAAKDAGKEAARYAEVLTRKTPHVVVMGIGENGHVAFNDPPVANFNDEKKVKVVKLDEICRKQQVHDGCFPCLNDVPRYAITLTVPTLMSAKHVFCIVPAKTKAQAVYNTLQGEIGEHCPATALRLKENARLYLDKDSAALVEEND